MVIGFRHDFSYFYHCELRLFSYDFNVSDARRGVLRPHKNPGGSTPAPSPNPRNNRPFDDLVGPNIKKATNFLCRIDLSSHKKKPEVDISKNEKSLVAQIYSVYTNYSIYAQPILSIQILSKLLILLFSSLWYDYDQISHII